jgi:hypothetical protein
VLLPQRGAISTAAELRGFYGGVGGEKCWWSCCLVLEEKTWLYIGWRGAETAGILGGRDWAREKWRERKGERERAGKDWRESCVDGIVVDTDT